jgi:putative DNA primase/helicase
MTSPLFAYTAPAARTGKSHLVDVACVMSHGHRAYVVVASSAPEELDKQLQALVSNGNTIIALDNQDSDHPLASNALSQILTQATIMVRPFGQNISMINVPSMAVVSITGNNLAIAKDLTERTLLCSLDAKMEVPGSRAFRFHPVVRAMETRVTLVNAALTILRAYVVAGRPDQKLTPMGGFEDWDALVRSAIVWLGCPDPCGTMQSIRDSDPGRGLHVTIMELWREQFPYTAISVGSVVERASILSNSGKSEFLNAIQATAQKDKSISLALGKWIRTRLNVVIGGHRFVASGSKTHQVYSVESISKKG